MRAWTQGSPCEPQYLHLENWEDTEGMSQLSQQLRRTGQALTAHSLGLGSSCSQQLIQKEGMCSNFGILLGLPTWR